jgi:Protein of unknown function (DUF1592)/Protein of unknown function (DUF1588)/Protein of unknown function (DUF1595)/Protein of unknown function (DUF1587)/Protein of unknown function (DUF1585)
VSNLDVQPRASGAAGLVLAAVVAGCYTGVPASGHDDGAGSDASSGDSDSADDGDDGAGASLAACDGEDVPAPLPNLVRLTHRQYDHTVRDLIGIDDHPSAVFLPDVSLAGFDNNAELLTVGDRLGRDYRRAAEDLAGRVVADPELFAALLPCAPADGDAGCADAFITEFGTRAFRRPLTSPEHDSYRALWAAGNGLYPMGSAFEQGIRVVIEAMLQSPHLLYRVELSTPAEGTPMVALAGFEVATRMSYLLWNSTPDDELLAAAEDGLLDDADGIAEQARRMLDDPRAHDPIEDFHGQWLQVHEYLDVAKDPAAFPGWNASFGDAMQQESRRFIERVVFELGGGYRELMSSPSSVVDAGLAEIYGVTAPETGFAAVELDPATRAGVLTQIGFLASRAYTNETSPIHRGVFVQRQLLCAPLPSPPPGVDPNLPPVGGDIHTNRDAVTVHTSAPECTACHSLINPPGFALEGYDPIGRVRSEDDGWPIDAAVTLRIDDADVAVDGGVALAHAIADSEAGPRCYATQWFRYAAMRKETPDDLCTIDALVTALTDDELPITELMIALTQTQTFRFRTGAP